MIAVPHDQPKRSSLSIPRFWRMWSTTAATSRTATSVVTIGSLASGGWSISFGRVERP